MGCTSHDEGSEFNSKERRQSESKANAATITQAPVIEQTREFLTSPEAPLLERGMKLTYTEKSKGERERGNNYRSVLSSRMQGKKEREREREREKKPSHSWYK